MKNSSTILANMMHEASKIPDDQRAGQHAFNVVYEKYPSIANKARATDLDPFYKDDRLPRFWMFVSSQLVQL